MRRLLPILCLLASALTPLAAAERVTLAVGGQGLFYYLPLAIAAERGFFAQAGLDVEVVDFPGGAKALQAVVGGSADFAAGAFEHVVNMRARGQALRAIVLLARYPAFVIALAPRLAESWRGPASLRGLTLGITAPGSSTHLFLKNVLHGAGLATDAATVIGVGGGAGAVAAMQRGELDGIVHLDPVISELEASGAAQVVLDTRTADGAQAVYGGPYHAACIYATQATLEDKPVIAHALVTAQVRALRWLATASTADIMAVVPRGFIGPDTERYRVALNKNRAMWSADGALDLEGARNVLDTLARFEPFVREADIDLESVIERRFLGAPPP